MLSQDTEAPQRSVWCGDGKDKAVEKMEPADEDDDEECVFTIVRS